MADTLTTPGALDWKKMKVQELRDELAARGLDTAGLKASLIERLETSAPKDANEGEAKEQGESKKDMEIDINEEVAADNSVEKTDVDKVREMKPSTEKVAEAGAEGKPVATVVDASNRATEEVSVVRAEPAAQEGSGKPLTTDLERKQKRAERFGLELMVSEVEKRRLRAARFGSSPTNGSVKSAEKTPTNQEASKMSPTVKEMEAVKRKARAARFGIEEVPEKPAGGVPVSSAAPASIDDAKKKARLARFGLTMKMEPVKLDPQEQEKKKLRAARFGLDTGETKVEAMNKVPVAQPAAS